MIADASNIWPFFVVDDLKKWGTNIKLFNDIFIYNILSATKFINGLIKKEKYNFDVVCVHDWLSSISGLVIKNETKIPVVFHTHSTEWGRSGGQGSEVVSHLERAMAQNSRQNNNRKLCHAGRPYKTWLVVLQNQRCLERCGP